MEHPEYDYIIHNDRYEVEYKVTPVKTTKGYDWFDTKDIVRHSEIEPIENPLEEILSTTTMYLYGEDSAGFNPYEGMRVLYPTDTTNSEFKVTQKTYNDDYRPEERRVLRKVGSVFSPTLKPNNRYWYVRYSQNRGLISILDRSSQNHPNEGWFRSIPPKIRDGIVKQRYLCKWTTIAISFPDWFPLQFPVINGRTLPFALARYHRNADDNPEKGNSRIIHEEETKRIQSGFRFFTINDVPKMVLDVPKPKEGVMYGIMWHNPSIAEFMSVYPKKL